VTQNIYISHVVGRCAACGFPILDSGYSDDMQHDFLFDNLYPYDGNDWFFRTFHREVYDGME